MSVLIHRADHPRLLVRELCRTLSDAPPDPLQPELISVPTNGIQRWLSEQIALDFAARGVGDGIAANIDWPYPGRLVRHVLGRVPGMEATLTAWRGREAERHIEVVLIEDLDEPWLKLLDRFVRSGVSGDGSIDDAQRLRAARKIGRLYGTYGRRRPDMIRAWARGHEVGPGGEPIADDAVWQPRLWHRLRESIGIPSPPEALPGALEALRAGEVDLDLPPRLSVYGLTSIDPSHLAVLHAVGAHRDVHLYLLHPSPALWDAVAARLGDGPFGDLPPRREDPSRDISMHPLVRSWAQDGRELQITLAHRGLGVTELPPPTSTAPGTLLELLQSDVRNNEQTLLRDGYPLRTAVAEGTDRSVQVHVCYGTQRQVEVARDAILHLFRADDTLQPRDVVIMTPDLETYAPLIEAAFPAEGSGSGLPDLRVRIADRAPARRNPLIRFAGTLLALAASRLDAGAVRDLVALPMVQRRFSLDPDTVGRIEDLITDANVRWGLDADHRERFGTAPREEHTWRRGLTRALAGVFYTDSPIAAVGGVAPMEGVEAEAALDVGHLANIVGRLEAAVELLVRRRPSSEWTEAIATTVRLLATPEFGQDWQWSQLERTLERTFSPEAAGADPEIGLDEAIVLTAPWTDDRPSPLHHQTGNVTVCTLVPMRSVPYRVVCLLGMDAERFPRTSRVDGDDLLVDHELVGDHDRGAEDRQLLLDALMAAGDSLLVTYAGRDELTNAAYPPAVPVAELLDVVTETAGETAADRVVTEHPLQSFSRRNFRPDALGVEGPWGFDPMYAAGAKALRDRTAAPEPLPGAIVIPSDTDEEARELTLDDLIAYFRHPCRTFVRGRMRLSIPEAGERADDELPVELDGLARWSITNRLLEGLTRGFPLEGLAAHELGRDSLPSGALGTEPLERTEARAAEILAVAVEAGFDPAGHQQHAGDAATPTGSLSGSVTVDPEAGLVADVTPSRLKGKHRLALYLRVLFLTALEPATAWRGLLVGRHARGPGLDVVTIGPLDGEAGDRGPLATSLLGDLIDLYQDGMTRPLPIFSETSYTWVTARPSRRREDTKRAWVPDRYGWGAEADDRYHQMLFPGLHTVDDLLATEFPALAERIWKPVTTLLGPKR